MIINRTKNAISGTLFGFIQRIITLIFPFIIRTIFIWTLGAEYLGLSSLFTSILQVMNLAELGVGAALIFSMYQPIAVDGKDKICALMRLYRRYYNIIGFIILIAGIAIMPFLPHLISGNVPADVNIYILYLMQLSATVLSYWLFAYRNSLFQAHQRTDIISIIGICISLVTYTLQIVSLLIFRNYYVYLSINIALQILNNLVTAIVSKRMYPEYVPKGNLSRTEIKEIHHKVVDLFTAKLGGVISNSFDTIIVSAFLGLTMLAMYQNYFYIVSAVSGIIMVFFSATQAGIGNYLIKKSNEESAQLLNNLNFVVLFVVNVCCTCLITLYQPFMRAWVGEKYMLDFSLVIMFTAYLFAYILIRPVIVFKDAAGMWKEDKFRPLISSMTNLILNLVTVKRLGLYGVLGSTIVSYLLVSFPWVLFNINKCMFKINIRRFMRREFMYALATMFSCGICCWICNKIQFTNIIATMIIYLAISLVFSSVIFIIAFYRTEESAYFMNKVKGILRGIYTKVNGCNKKKGYGITKNT